MKHIERVRNNIYFIVSAVDPQSRNYPLIKDLFFYMKHDGLENYGFISHSLLLRAVYHDLSKFSEGEANGYSKLISGMKPSDDREIEKAIQRHYEANSHHPEHHERGIMGMSTVDLLEMCADWEAASHRVGGKASEWITYQAKERFGIPDELYVILGRILVWLESCNEGVMTSSGSPYKAPVFPVVLSN